MRNPLWPSIQARVTGFLNGLIRQRETSEERFRQLFERMPEPVWIVTDTHFIEANPAALAAIGYSDRPSFLQLPLKDSEEYLVKNRLVLQIKKKAMLRAALVNPDLRVDLDIAKWAAKICNHSADYQVNLLAGNVGANPFDSAERYVLRRLKDLYKSRGENAWLARSDLRNAPLH